MTGVVPVVLAVTGGWEAPLASGLGAAPGLDVVRRCPDVADLLAVVAAGAARACIVSADLRGLDAEALAQLALAGCAVVAVVEPGERSLAHRLDQLGVEQVLDADRPAADVAAAVLAAVAAVHAVAQPDGADRRGGPGRPVAGGADLRALRLGAGGAPTRRLGHADPRAAATSGRPEVAGGGVADAVPAPECDEPGRVVVVWGPAGAPGRTTVGIGLAAELAASGLSTLLVDADTYGACVAQSLGLLDESPGLLGAARAADRGALDLRELSRHAPLVADHLRVLTGVVRADRWPELRAPSFGSVLELSRSLASWVVVDVGFCLEQDEELAYDTAAPRRNAATLVALAAADAVVAVGSADPVGLQRLVRALPELTALTDVRPVVVANRLRAGAVGSSPARRVRDALERYAGVVDPVLVAHDVSGLDAAMLAGRTLAEHGRSSPVRQGLLDLAARLGATRVAPGAPAGGAPSGRRTPVGAH